MNDDKKDTSEQAKSKSARRQRSALIYLVILFAAAFLMLLLAYFMQQRSSAEIMGNLNDLQQSMGSIQSIDQLREENHALKDENQALQQHNGTLEQQLKEQEAQIEQLEGDLTAAQSDLEDLQGRFDDDRGTVNAFHTLNLLHALYDQGRIADCKSEVASLDIYQVNGKETTEYYLGVWISKVAVPEILETYNPLEDWLALKEAILGAEIEE